MSRWITITIEKPNSSIEDRIIDVEYDGADLGTAELSHIVAQAALEYVEGHGRKVVSSNISN